MAAKHVADRCYLKELEDCIARSIEGDEFIREACAPLVSGGKRLRPILFLLCSNAKDKLPPERILPLATALELIHTASLVHDDILDGAKKRRGFETANSKYGVQTAVLVGDYLFAKAFQLVAEEDYGAEVSAILSTLVRKLCVGEIMQDRALFVIPTPSEYYTRINLKTAFFLSTCCRLGGLIANFDRHEIDNLANYGSNLGLAFQIVDDLLDFFGDEKVTGKHIGGDLKSGVITLPVLRAIEVSDKSEILKAIITDNSITDTEVDAAIGIISNTDAAEYCKLRAEEHIVNAKMNLPLTIKDTERGILEQLASFIVERNW